VARQSARSTSQHGQGQQGQQGQTQQGKTQPAKQSGASRALEAMRAAEKAPELDNLIHERMRLGIVSALAANESLTFTELKELLKTTDGNISVHTRKLEEADYIACIKSFEGRIPKTQYRLTPSGRRALERYLDHMEALVRAARDR
jgi:DNA-binding MarR family transcriptional regulator